MIISATLGTAPGPLAGAPTAALVPPPPRPPKAPPPRKAAHAAECERLEQLPNIGPSLAGNLRSIGIQHPAQLASADAFALYQQLCSASGRRQDPCVLDTFMAACDFMRGGAARPWWHFTAERKQRFGVL